MQSKSHLLAIDKREPPNPKDESAHHIGEFRTHLELKWGALCRRRAIGRASTRASRFRGRSSAVQNAVSLRWNNAGYIPSAKTDNAARPHSWCTAIHHKTLFTQGAPTHAAAIHAGSNFLSPPVPPTSDPSETAVDLRPTHWCASYTGLHVWAFLIHCAQTNHWAGTKHYANYGDIRLSAP